MDRPDIKRIQQVLKDQGCDPGDIDGSWGRKTIAAVKQFQQKKGLQVDGIVGPQTIEALFGDQRAPEGASSSGPLVWLEEALNLIGTKEAPGARNNPTLIRWAEGCNIDYDSDDIPWCGLFVAHCIASALPEEPLPNAPLGARNWRKFGKTCNPVEGAVLVFWRGQKNGPFGHVGFYRGEDDKAFHVLGGNQSDSVSTCRIAKNRLLEARWPVTAASLSGTAVVLNETGGQPLSHNEA